MNSMKVKKVGKTYLPPDIKCVKKELRQLSVPIMLRSPIPSMITWWRPLAVELDAGNLTSCPSKYVLWKAVSEILQKDILHRD